MDHAEDDLMRSIGLPKLLTITGRYVSDNTSEAREAARGMLAHIKRAHAGSSIQDDWETFVRKELPSTQALAVAKVQC